MYLAEKTTVTHANTSNLESHAARAARYAAEFGGQCDMDSSTYATHCRRKYYIRSGENQGPAIAEPLFDDDKSSRLIRLTMAGLKVVMHLRTKPGEIAKLKATFGGGPPKLVPPFTSKPGDKVQYDWGALATQDGKVLYAGTLSFTCLACGVSVHHTFKGRYPDDRFAYLVVRCECGVEWGVYLFEPMRAPDPLGA
jgi:hypothetical protein